MEKRQHDYASPLSPAVVKKGSREFFCVLVFSMVDKSIVLLSIRTVGVAFAFLP